MMLQYTTKESKYSYLMLSCFLIPIVIEMPSLLTLWLKEYPPYTVEFCRMVIISTIFDQATIGLTSANQAVGQIRNYSLLISTMWLLVLPLAWLCMHLGMSASAGMQVYLLVAILCGAIRIPFLVRTAGLDAKDYLCRVAVRSLVPVCGCVGVSLLMSLVCCGQYRFLLTEGVGVGTSVVLIYMFSLTPTERQWVLGRLSTLRKSLCSISLHRST